MIHGVTLLPDVHGCAFMGHYCYLYFAGDTLEIGWQVLDGRVVFQ